MLALTCLGLVLSSCTSTDDRVVAQVGDKEITVGKIKQDYLAISEYARPKLETIEEKEAFAKDVVAKEVIRMEAEKAGFGESPEAMAAREVGLQNKAWQDFFEDEIRGKVNVTEDELRALYDRQKTAYQIAWIFLRSRARAEEALEKIRSGRPFGEIAEIYSIDPSRSRGGDLGYRPIGNMPDNVEAAIESMSPGDMTGVLEYDGYYAIIKLVDKQDREPMDYESAKVGLESMLMTKKITERQKALAEEYRRKFHVTYNDDVIALVAERTRAANPTEDGPPGRLPKFSGDELNLVIASRDGNDWTVGQYLERIGTVRDFGRPSYGADSEVIRSVMRDYLTGELWVLAAMDMGYGEREDVVSAADREYEREMITAFHDSLVKDVKIDEAALRDFYDENKEQLMSEPTYNLAIIVLENKPAAQDVYGELRAGAGFAALARARSIDPMTKDEGGEIKETFVGRSLQQFPDVYDAVLKMKVGEYTEPMLLPPSWGPEGWMILKLVKKEDARQLKFEEVETMLSERVLQLEQDKVFAAWLADKMEEKNVTVNPDVLASIDFSAL
jgi:peptidyl-prolyl cis-trans isomerase C